jgi:hypothetical protein
MLPTRCFAMESAAYVFAEFSKSLGLSIEFDSKSQKLFAAFFLVIVILPPIRSAISNLLSSYFEDDAKVPKFHVGSNGFLSQVVYGICDRARWFNSVFFESVIGQFGMDPEAVFPALKSASHAQEHGASDVASLSCGLLSFSDLFSSTIPSLPYALLLFSLLIKRCQKQICTPATPNDAISTFPLDMMILASMLACCFATQSDAMRCIMLVYVCVNAFALSFRFVVFRLLVSKHPESGKKLALADGDEHCSEFATELEDEDAFIRDVPGLITFRHRKKYITKWSVQTLYAATGWLRQVNEQFAVIALLQLADEADESMRTWLLVAAFVILLVYLSVRALYTYSPSLWWIFDSMVLCLMLALSLDVRCAEPALSMIMIIYTAVNAGLVLSRFLLLADTGENPEAKRKVLQEQTNDSVHLVDCMLKLKEEMLSAGYSKIEQRMKELRAQLDDLKLHALRLTVVDSNGKEVKGEHGQVVKLPGVQGLVAKLVDLAYKPETEEQVHVLREWSNADALSDSLFGSAAAATAAAESAGSGTTSFSHYSNRSGDIAEIRHAISCKHSDDE